MRASEDGELLPPVVVDIPDVLYLQVVDTDDCEDWPAPSDPGERTHCDERINASDVAYVPLARAERAEAEAQSAILAASDAERALANCRALLDALYDSAAETEVRLNAKLDKAQAGLAALEAADGWRWQTVENWLAQGIEHIGYWLTAETSLGGGLGFSRYTAWRYWNGDGWDDLREDDTVHFVAPFPEWPAAPGDGGKGHNNTAAPDAGGGEG